MARTLRRALRTSLIAMSRVATDHTCCEAVVSFQINKSCRVHSLHAVSTVWSMKGMESSGPRVVGVSLVKHMVHAAFDYSRSYARFCTSANCATVIWFLTSRPLMSSSGARSNGSHVEISEPFAACLSRACIRRSSAPSPNSCGMQQQWPLSG